MNRMKKIFVILPLGLLCFAGCNIQDIDIANLEKPTLTTEVFVPLGSATFTMRELIEEVSDEELNVEEDSITSKLFFRYNETISFSNTSDLIDIPNISNTISLTLPETPASGTAQVVQIDTVINFPYQPAGNERLTELFYSAGEVSFSLDMDYSTTYTSTLASTTNVSSGVPILFTEASTAAQSLAGHKTEFTDANDQNNFSVNLSLSIQLPAGQAIGLGESAQLGVTFDNQEFSKIYGYFGEDTIRIGDQLMQLDFFEQLNTSGLNFNDPQFTFKFENELGVPLGINFKSFFGISGSGNSVDTTYLSGTITETLQIVDAANDVTGDAGVLTSVVQTSNSTIQGLLAKSPSAIGISLEAQTNVDNPDEINFITDNSEIVIDVEAIIPLAVKLVDVTKNVGLSLGGGLKFDEADSLTLRVVSVNEIPFSATFDLEVWDENDSVLFVVPGRRGLEIPYLRPDRTLDQPRKHVEDIPINRAGIEAMNIGKKLNLRVTLNTPKSETSEIIYVNILADYVMDLQISASGFLKKDL